MERSSEIEGRERPTDRETGRRRDRERKRERRMSEGYKATKLGQFRLVRDRLRFRLDRRMCTDRDPRIARSSIEPISILYDDSTLFRRSTNITRFFTPFQNLFPSFFLSVSPFYSRDIAITLLSFPYLSIGNPKKSLPRSFISESEKMRDREKSGGKKEISKG